MIKRAKIIRSEHNSDRFIAVNADTSECINNATHCGYKSIETAVKALRYKYPNIRIVSVDNEAIPTAIEYKTHGRTLKITQCETNNHIMISENDKMIFHAQNNIPKTEKEMQQIAEDMIMLEKYRERFLKEKSVL